MISEWLAGLQYRLGATIDTAGHIVPDTSWSARLQGSDRLWMLIEGTHVLSLMLFAGTILFVDLRLLGAVLRSVPVSRVAGSLLPWTVAGFLVTVTTGSALFFSDPLEYFHNFAFRLKALFLLGAAVNIFWFHFRVQANRPQWDGAEVPPRAARISAATSLAVWFAVIVAGRYMAYDWVKCMNPGALVSEIAQCSTYDATLAEIDAETAQ
ncbi:hypothetical protein H7F51_07950 [Novosphingobium flavum]|uniref:DUF6644 domain-containing protein n=1 Tax=Novosphingobium flavum TaxID=1778672 RepID=A0A7X1FR58_9SPHN|nr:DUF6644 family protein [Novosphingobium flavum]MBC2665451.1 hypothetical protein [Novosphingobium flavum]